MVFATTSYFLERMGLRSLDELPPLAPHLPGVEELEAELGQLAECPAGAGRGRSRTSRAAGWSAALRVAWSGRLGR